MAYDQYDPNSNNNWYFELEKGRQTGMGSGFYGSFGNDQYYNNKSQNSSKTTNTKSTNSNSSGLYLKKEKIPGFVKTAQYKKEQKRRKSNAAYIKLKSGVFAQLSGKVLSYLDENGNLISNKQGDLVRGEVVNKKVHLQRLKLAYENYFKNIISGYESTDNDELRSKVQTDYEDAKQRLELLTKNIYLSPYTKNKKDFDGLIEHKHIKKRLLRKDKEYSVPGKFTKLKNIAIYDDHLRHFIKSTFTEKYALILGDKYLFTYSARSAIAYFMALPCQSTTSVWSDYLNISSRE